LAGKFSFQYTAAAALLDGQVGVASFADARRFAPDMEALLPRIDIIPDAAREGRFDRMRVDLVIELEDGRELRGMCDGPYGIWGRPVAQAALQVKWHDCFQAAFGAETGPVLLREASAFGDLDAAGLYRLMGGLGAPG
jgi:aconitate decarboxylase